MPLLWAARGLAWIDRAVLCDGDDLQDNQGEFIEALRGLDQAIEGLQRTLKETEDA